jgi:hypothetical protein
VVDGVRGRSTLLLPVMAAQVDALKGVAASLSLFLSYNIFHLSASLALIRVVPSDLNVRVPRRYPGAG